MTIVLRFVAALLTGVATLPAVATAGDASRWADGFHSRARLVSGGATSDGYWAGVEIALDPGFKTYWREPGEAGLPPRFDWSGSDNVAAIDLRWPAPERIEDAGGVANGYHGHVVFPIVVQPQNPGRPTRVTAVVDYGVCKDICIPAHAELTLSLAGDPTFRPLVEPFLAAVPKVQPLGAPGPLSVLGVEPIPGNVSAFAAAVRAPEGASPALFAEGPPGWYLSTSRSAQDGRFQLTVEEKPKDAAGEIPIRLTLVAGSDAVESEARLPAVRTAAP